MVVGRRKTAGMYPSLNEGNYIFNKVKQLKYLGSVINEKNEIVKEISARILSGNRAFYGPVKLLRSKSLSRELKIQLYTTLLPVLTLSPMSRLWRECAEKTCFGKPSGSILF